MVYKLYLKLKIKKNRGTMNFIPFPNSEALAVFHSFGQV